jgi:two-component system phosphate regulon response regulator PhoB
VQTPQAKTVAIMTGNSALSALLEMVLAAHAHLQVRVFNDVISLSGFMRTTSVDIVVGAFGPGPEGASSVIAHLRREAETFVHPAFQSIALSDAIDGDMKAICLEAGIDEIIAKPMSPRYLEERVLARLGEAPVRRLRTDARPERPNRTAAFPSNVIPLFGPRADALTH